MDLQDFLNNSAFTSKNTGFDFNASKIDVSKINQQEPKKKEEFKSTQAPDLQQFLDGKVSLDPARNGGQTMVGGGKRYEEYPVPSAPPYIATIVNFPKDLTESGMKAWFEDGLQKPDAVALINIPKNMDNTNKNRAFVEFKARDHLENALKLSGSFLNENKVYVDVAPPNSYMNGGSNRSGGFGNRYSAGLQFDWTKGTNTPQFEEHSHNNDNNSSSNMDWSRKGNNLNDGAHHEPIDWSKKGNSLSDAPDHQPMDWSKKGHSLNDDSPQQPMDWSQKGANIREQRNQGVSPASIDWSQKGVNARDSPRTPQPQGFERSQMGSHLKQASPEVSASSLDWSRKGSNVKSSSNSPKIDVSSLKWEKGANFSSSPAPRENSINKKKAFAVPEKGSGLQSNSSKSSSKVAGFEALSLEDNE